MLEKNDYISHEYFKRAYKMNTHRMMLSYMGTINEWEEFINLPSEYVPDFIKKLSIDYDKDGNLTLDGEFVKATFNDIENMENTQLFVGVEINPEKVNELMAARFTVKPDKNSANVLFIGRYSPPVHESSEEYKALWNKMISSEAPYHDALFQQGEYHTLYKVLRDSKYSVGHEENNEKVYLIQCSLTSDKDRKINNKICSNFKENIQLKQ